jgi:hypothetical protein
MQGLILVSLWLAAPPASAQPDTLPVPLTETAELLARRGARQGDPQAVIAAAQILRVVERGTPRVRRDTPADGPAGPWQGPMSSAALLGLARELARTREDAGALAYAEWLLKLPDSAAITRGARGGPVWADAYLGSQRDVRYTIAFTGGQTPNLVRIAASRSDAQLECVLSEAGEPARVVLRVQSLAGTCALEWRQRTGGPMGLRIVNRGSAAYFVLSSN